jgi:EAL domain-containing protein (putative c-di-GMP-specific phosphodiesterase class I)
MSQGSDATRSTPMDSSSEPDRPAATRVLVVDDDPDVLAVYTEILAESGFAVDAASDGFRAVEHLRAKSYDVILSDIAMPGMDGIQFLRHVRDFDLDVPVILSTGNPAIESAVRAVEEGAFRYLFKPVSASELEETVRRAAQLHVFARLKRQSLDLLGQGHWSLGDRASLEPRFDRALQTLWMAFQPIVAPSTHSVFAYEALVRSGEPTLPMPGDLFRAAERLGRVAEIGLLIRRKVAEALQHAPADALVFVNVHPLNLNDEQLYSPSGPLSRVAARIVLEVTERASLETIPDIRGKVAALKSLGFRLALDDLGAGYAGLGALTQIEPDVVKIDMSLIRDVDAHPTKQTVIRSMATLCRELGMRLVAEGVETDAERSTLSGLGCDLLQGFLFGQPEAGFPQVRW